VTEDGNLQCWAETRSRLAQRMRSFTLAVNGESGSVYKGLAITPFRSGNRLYAANFGLRRIDALDGAYQPILNGAFARPTDVPEDFAPFNIQFLEYEIDGIARQGLFVAYARTTADPVEEEQGPGLGFIAEFDLDGRHLRTLGHTWRLNAPWGMVVAPEDFGPFSKCLIVGNFGDGTLVAIGLKSGRQRGYLRGAIGRPSRSMASGASPSATARASDVRASSISPPGRTARPTACSAACTSWTSEPSFRWSLEPELHADPPGARCPGREETLLGDRIGRR